MSMRPDPTQPATRRLAPASPSLPYHTLACYACDAPACGVRDRRLEGGLVEAACARHADPTIRAHAACVYCSGRVVVRSLDIDGELAHKSCHAVEVQS